MTTKTRHVVVDGSNIATEGRSMPSLAQLNEAVLAFMAEHPDVTVTVVVDATFGHRIDKSEVKEFDSAVANNELVAPPAGAVGRGDAFVLSIANKAGATVLSNDSFQEFHGDYPWLFDDGRLIGGKPVPNIGWVFVERVPVRGPISRKAMRESKGDDKRGGRRKGRASKAASEPMPVPTSPPPGVSTSGTGRAGASADGKRSGSRRSGARGADSKRSDGSGRGEARADATGPDRGGTDSTVGATATGSGGRGSGPPTSRDMVNDLMPFLEFVEHHPVGTSVNAEVDSYASHGAYVRIGDVLAYVPLRLMADPPPRSAREVMKVGDAVTLVVADFAPARRSIDCAMPHMAVDLEPQDTAAVIEATPGAEGATERGDADDATESTGRGRSKTTAPRSRAGKKAPAEKAASTAPATEAPAKKAPAKKAPAEKAASKAPARKAPATERPAKKAASKAPARKAPATEASAKKASAKKAPAKKAASKASAKKAPAKKAASKASAKKAPAKKAPATKAPAKKAPAKKAPAKKAARSSGGS